ncbi:hypothetical protein [Aurantimonas sp. A3-2-R12]|uniref:hypothetical protein n=1 Tax=Aurantimonas sp. A3-2-R12 TaxID=3114362 RepID=UPI002E18884B
MSRLPERLDLPERLALLDDEPPPRRSERLASCERERVDRLSLLIRLDLPELPPLVVDRLLDDCRPTLEPS